MLSAVVIALLLQDPDAFLRKVFNDPDRPSVVLGDTSTPRVPMRGLPRATPDLPVITCYTEPHGMTVKQWCEIDYGPSRPHVIVRE